MKQKLSEYQKVNLFMLGSIFHGILLIAILIAMQILPNILQLIFFIPVALFIYWRVIRLQKILEFTKERRDE